MEVGFFTPFRYRGDQFECSLSGDIDEISISETTRGGTSFDKHGPCTARCVIIQYSDIDF